METADRLEHAACPLCGADEPVLRHQLGVYGSVRCRRCGGHYLSPRLDEAAMLEMYDDTYFEGGPVGYLSYADQEPALRATFERFVRWLVSSGRAGGDLLEIGAGYGYLLEAATREFRTVTGTELSKRAAEEARSRGLDVVTGTIADLPAERRFDCIVATHVIEHLYKPRSELERIVERLRPGGNIVLATPDIGSPWASLFGRRWPSYKVPEHVVFFDRRSLTRLMAGAGLVDLRSAPYRHAFPLALVAQKAGLGWLARRLGGIRRMPVWLPRTTVAVAGRRRGVGAGNR